MLDHWRLIIISLVAALLGFVIAFTLTSHVSEEARVQQNYLQNFLNDLRAPQAGNESVRRYECVDSAYKAKRFIDAHCPSDAVNEYLRLCANIE